MNGQWPADSVDRRPVSALVPYARNSRTHSDAQVAQIAASIREWGWTTPVLVDEDGTIIAGHGRVLAAQKLGLDEVPCMVARGWTEAQRRAYVIADNKLALNAGWDDEMLRVEMGGLKDLDFDLDLTGFGEEELTGLFGEGADGGTDPDAVPDAPEIARTKRGDVWRLGRHRLLCGDATAAHGFGDECSTLFFDPPWDGGFSMPARESTLAFTDGQRLGDVVSLFGAPAWVFAWDCVSSWYTPNRPLKRMKLCAWYGSVGAYNPDGSHYGDSGEERTVTNTRGSYKFTPDPRGKHLSDVFACPITKLHSQGEHSHGKPVDWVRMLIANCTQGDVFDPFAGEGTAIIACEQLGRSCRAIEIDPLACDVIVKRWQEFTGKAATLESTGEAF